MTVDRVLAEVREEREAQDVQWGGPEHDDGHTITDWQRFLHERVLRLGDAGVSDRDLLIQVAALAVAAVESYDRHRSRVNLLKLTDVVAGVFSKYRALDGVKSGLASEVASAVSRVLEAREI